MGLEGDHLRIRVTRDRCQIFVDFSPLGTAEWFDEDVVLQLVGGERAGPGLADAGRTSLAPSANAIRAHFAAIVDRFQPDTWPRSRVELMALQERRARELLE
jgi:hypothetical protein